MSCTGITAINNIAAGCVYAGITIPGHDCGNPSGSGHDIANNVAHSGSRNGIISFPDPARSSSGTCYEGSGLVTYKNNENGVIGFFGTKEFILSDVLSIESLKGVTPMIGRDTDLISRSELKDSKIYGSSEIEETKCSSSMGYMIPQIVSAGKPVHITMPSGLPMYKIMGNANFVSTAHVTNV